MTRTPSDARRRRQSMPYLRAHEHKGLLRFITCGSVDDGKSTLIGRLLYDRQDAVRGPARGARRPTRSRSARRAASSTSRCWSTASPPSASRASPSTSPTATSPPTGASSSSPTRPGTSSTRATWSPAPRPPTRRDPGRRAQGRADADAPPQLHRLAARHPARRAGRQQDGPGRLRRRRSSTRSRPTTARSPSRSGSRTSPASRCRRCSGDNIAGAQRQMPLVRRPDAAGAPRDGRRSTTTLPSTAVPHAGAMGQPARTSTSAASAGTIVGGTSRRATAVARAAVGPREHASRASSPRTATSPQAVAGQSVTLTLADEIDVSRGDVISPRPTTRRRSPTSSRRTLVWMGEEPMLPGRPLPDEDRRAHGQRDRCTELKYKVNVNTLEHVAAKHARAQRDRRLQPGARPAGRVRSLCRQPRHSAASS